MATRQQLKEMTIEQMMEIIKEDWTSLSSGSKVNVCYFWSFSNVMKILPELMKMNFNFSVDCMNDRMLRCLTLKPF